MGANPEPCVARVPIFAGLDAGEQAAVAALARPLRLARGESAYIAGAAVGRLLVVHHGRLTLVHRSTDGREQVVRVLQDGDFVGEDAFLSGARPEHDAVAAGETQLCSFAHADLAGLIRSHPGIAVRMLQSVSARLADAERMLAAVSGTEVTARLAAYLLDQTASRDGDGRAVVSLAMPKKDIASYLGTTPESLSRALAALVRMGAIERSRHNAVVILDAAALDARARGRGLDVPSHGRRMAP